VTILLARDLDKRRDSNLATPLEHELTLSLYGEHQLAGDLYSVRYHSGGHSHLDGLAHRFTGRSPTSVRDFLFAHRDGLLEEAAT